MIVLHCCPEIGEHLVKHGDAVKDIGFQVEDLDAVFKVSFSFLFLSFSFYFSFGWVVLVVTLCIFKWYSACFESC